MNNNLFKNECRISIINRVNSLHQSTKPKWGEMNPTEMLRHCNSCNHQIFNGTRSDDSTSFKQYFLRILALYLSPHFVKNLKTEVIHNMKGKADVAWFEREREEFINLITQFGTVKKNLTLTHPAFGNISTKEWGIAAYKHIDHHLRQFGV